ncbi:uncharacterized protein KY384_005210 [Bacidia gigantensis]|uniref:uncharacterized protein n=1 Tax=Bacidia gigantensis TaxID=2732470 RepID=UPI001D03BD75|nr:uncharacterized protein KY384_005210 [Bacidia gigantensis]KAG8529729.1 hypothetical protein KY384_005210 [Bacidia gigantensis]
MSTLILPMSSPTSLKRSYDDAALEPLATSEPTQFISHTSLQQPLQSQHHPTTGTSEQFSNPSPQASSTLLPNASTNTQEKPTKKAKLTSAEKEVREIERKFKEQQKAEERAKKEEDRVRKEHEKAEKDAEKAHKAEERKSKDEARQKAKEERERLKEEEKAKKEEERQKKEEEKNKKERAQLKLNAFFGQSSGTRSSTASPAPDAQSQSSSRRNSTVGENPPNSTPRKSQASDFEQAFPPFFVHANVCLAPCNRFSRDEEALAFVQRNLDASFTSSKESTETLKGLRLRDSLSLPPQRKHECHKLRPSVKQIVANIEGGAQNPIILSEKGHAISKPADALDSIPIKYLKFKEDVRPPYIGTFSRIIETPTATKLSRKPCSRNLPKVNYDYDSEAEWEDPGEGEDLMSEGEEEPDDEDDGDMEGFLDDEDTVDGKNAKRRPLLGALEPLSTGLCWIERVDGPDLSHYRMDMLTEEPRFPIDPYSTAYWQQPTPSKPVSSTTSDRSTVMQPPRVPLNPITGQSMNKSTTTHTSVKIPKRLVPNELMDDFRSAVTGSDLTKLGLVEQLKKKFPKQSKDVIKDTLDAIAERVGSKLADRKWVLKPVE